MTLKLYGSPSSTSTQRAAVILHEKQLPFEFIHIDLAKGEQKLPEHMERSPFGQVPVLDDDGLILYDSRAICYYIVLKYHDVGPEPLVYLPSDYRSTAILSQVACDEMTRFNIIQPILQEKIAAGKGFSSAKLAELNSQLQRVETEVLDVYEKILSKQPYLCGSNLTMSDFFHLPVAHLLSKAGSDIMFSPKRPNVTRWFTEISSRPSWKAAIAPMPSSGPIPV